MSMQQSRSFWFWLKLAGTVLIYCTILGLSWAGTSIAFLSGAFGPSFQVLSMILGGISALGWIGMYFPDGWFKAQAVDPSEVAFRQNKKGLFFFFNGFGVLNALINAVITFFGSLVAVSAWSLLLGVHIGFGVQLVFCALAAVVGFLSAFFITRKRINEVVRNVAQATWEKIKTNLKNPRFWFAIVFALLASASSVIFSYYGGVNLFAQMTGFLGNAAVSFMAFLGTPFGQQLIGFVLGGVTIVAATSLYVAANIKRMLGDFKSKTNFGAWRVSDWVQFALTASIAVIAAAVQAYSVYGQLISLWPMLLGNAWILLAIVGVGLNFVFGFYDGLNRLINTIKEAIYPDSKPASDALDPAAASTVDDKPVPHRKNSVPGQGGAPVPGLGSGDSVTAAVEVVV